MTTARITSSRRKGNEMSVESRGMFTSTTTLNTWRTAPKEGQRAPAVHYELATRPAAESLDPEMARMSKQLETAKVRAPEGRA